MMKYRKVWIIFTVFVWLACCQGLFVLIQTSLGQRVVESTQGQLRQELDFSNFNFLARSITDYTTSGAIRCAVLERVSPDFLPVIDLRYMGKNCTVSPIELSGTFFNIELKSLNGDVFRFQFVSNNPVLFDLALWGFRILGVLSIVSIMLAMHYQAIAEIRVAQKVKEVAMQVSHDIRSPLAVLQMILEDKGDTPREIRESIQRINDIANNLLLTNHGMDTEKAFKVEIGPIVDSIVLEKRLEYRHRLHISIESELQERIGLLAVVNVVELKRVLSNLINNAVEAIADEGKVKIKVSQLENNKILLVVSDTGKGIPESVISKLGEKGFSYAKENENAGSGLGLYHAKKTIEKWGGDLKVESVEGKGTWIKIVLPLSDDFNAESDEVVQSKSYFEYVYVDDDELLRMVWKSRATKKNIKLLTLQTTSDFDQYRDQVHKELTHIYIDSKLSDTDILGEEFAKKLHSEGFKNLYMATGFEAEHFRHLAWLKYAGKKCPF